jgi:hypothetical protein
MPWIVGLLIQVGGGVLERVELLRLVPLVPLRVVVRAVVPRPGVGRQGAQVAGRGPSPVGRLPMVAEVVAAVRRPGQVGGLWGLQRVVPVGPEGLVVVQGQLEQPAQPVEVGRLWPAGDVAAAVQGPAGLAEGGRGGLVLRAQLQAE